MLSTKSAPKPAAKLAKTMSAAGRPRAFAPEAALNSALDVFWRKGYQATSLDDLTAAMQLSRSSFYACFGSKHAALLAAVRSYADHFYAAISTLASDAGDPRHAFEVILARIVDIDGGVQGCFFLNTVTELAPHDPELADFSRYHLARINALLASLLVQLGHTPERATDRAVAALALAMGAVTLRKAGVAREQILAVLDLQQLLLCEQGLA